MILYDCRKSVFSSDGMYIYEVRSTKRQANVLTFMYNILLPLDVIWQVHT